MRAIVEPDSVFAVYRAIAANRRPDSPRYPASFDRSLDESGLYLEYGPRALTLDQQTLLQSVLLDPAHFLKARLMCSYSDWVLYHIWYAGSWETVEVTGVCTLVEGFWAIEVVEELALPGANLFPEIPTLRDKAARARNRSRTEEV